MCYIVEEGPGGGGTRFSVDKGVIPYIFQKGSWIQVHKKTKLKCFHPDGRSDTYLLEPGKRLVVDEEATLEILTIYPDEMPILTESPEQQNQKPQNENTTRYNTNNIH